LIFGVKKWFDTSGGYPNLLKPRRGFGWKYPPLPCTQLIFNGLVYQGGLFHVELDRGECLYTPRGIVEFCIKWRFSLPCAKNKFGIYTEDVVALGWWVGYSYISFLHI
jgi:hypothetical protein